MEDNLYDLSGVNRETLNKLFLDAATLDSVQGSPYLRKLAKEASEELSKRALENLRKTGL